eukprot:863786-Amphidinium_carterae.2
MFVLLHFGTTIYRSDHKAALSLLWQSSQHIARVAFVQHRKQRHTYIPSVPKPFAQTKPSPVSDDCLAH